MAGLLDIADMTETVTVGGTKIEVRGVSAVAIAILLSRFPELRKAMSGGRQLEPMALMSIGEDVTAAIIAAGCGHIGDPIYEAKARKLSAGPQAALLAPIIRLTMPGGFGPFVEELTAAMAVVGLSNTAPATKSPKASKPSSQSGTRPPQSGRTRRVR